MKFQEFFLRCNVGILMSFKFSDPQKRKGPEYEAEVVAITKLKHKIVKMLNFSIISIYFNRRKFDETREKLFIDFHENQFSTKQKNLNRACVGRINMM